MRLSTTERCCSFPIRRAKIQPTLEATHKMIIIPPISQKNVDAVVMSPPVAKMMLIREERYVTPDTYRIYAVGVFCLRQPLDAAREPRYVLFVGVRFFRAERGKTAHR